MYLRGRTDIQFKRQKRSNPARMVFWVVLILAAIYVNQFIVPVTPPLFIPTPTPTISPEAYLAEAQKAFDAGQIKQAIAAYTNALYTDPTNRATYVALARVLAYDGQLEEALKNAELALVGNDNYALAHAVRGWILNKSGDTLTAEAAIRRALEIDPNNPLFNAYYAEVLIDRNDFGDIEKAAEVSRNAVTIGANLLETHVARAYVLLSTSNYEEALAEYRSAAAINKGIPDVFLNMGYCYLALEDYANAIQSFQQADVLNPANPIPDLEISRVYARIGDFPKAVQNAEKAVQNDPLNPHRYGNLGIMLYKNNQYPEAANVLTLAVRGGTNADGNVVPGLPLNYGFAAQYYYTYGLALARLNRCAEAVPILRALIITIPDDPIAQFNAEEGLSICKQAIPTATPEPTESP